MARSDGDIDRREAIMEAALALFGEFGFHGTAVPQVAARAGVGAGTIYRYFESKEALVNALYQRWKTAFLTEVIQGIPMQATVREQFHVFWTRMASFAAKNRDALAFLELHHHGPYLDAKSRELEEQTLAVARVFFDETRRLEVTKPIESEALIALLLGAFLGLVKASWSGNLTLTQAVLDSTEACMWEAIRR